MKIWVAGVENPLASRAADRLDGDHDVVTSGASVDLRVPEQVAPLAAEVEAIVHSAMPQVGTTTDEEMLDRSARGAYVVIDEAVKAGVERAVLISSLSCFEDYPAEYNVDETWRPMPRPEAASLAPLMAERTFREFARQGGITAICLRFGEIDAPEGTSTNLALEAVERALTMTIEDGSYRWWLFHISEGARYPLSAAKAAPLSLEGEG
jgi:nucleoside-diphosphate-sugar epimerase